MKAKIGAPSKLNEQVANEIERAIRLGAPINVACDLVGIDRNTFYAWIERGEAETSGPFRDFSNTIKKARAETQLEALETVRSGRFGWQGSAWYLERCHPKHYGRSSR